MGTQIYDSDDLKSSYQKGRRDAIEEFLEKVAGLLAYYEQSDKEYHYTNWVEKDIRELYDEIDQMKEGAI